MTFHVIRGQITKERRPHLPVTHSACIRQIQLILLQLGEQAVIRETEGTMCAEAAAAPQLKQPSRTTEHVSSKGFTDYCGYFTSARARESPTGDLWDDRCVHRNCRDLSEWSQFYFL